MLNAHIVNLVYVWCMLCTMNASSSMCTDKDPLVDEFYDELFKHWSLKKTPIPPIIDLEAQDEAGTDLSGIFEVKKEDGDSQIESQQTLVIDDPYLCCMTPVKEPSVALVEVHDGETPNTQVPTETSRMSRTPSVLSEGAKATEPRAPECDVKKLQLDDQPSMKPKPSDAPEPATTKVSSMPSTTMSDEELGDRIARVRFLG